MLGVFPHESGLGGCLVHNPQYGYSPAGDMNDVIARVGDAGGAVLLQKTALGEDTGGGYVAWVRDTEGNKVRFYSTE